MSDFSPLPCGVQLVPPFRAKVKGGTAVEQRWAKVTKRGLQPAPADLREEAALYAAGYLPARQVAQLPPDPDTPLFSVEGGQILYLAEAMP